MQSDYIPRCMNRPYGTREQEKGEQEREENQDLIKCSLPMAHEPTLFRILKSNNPSILLTPPPTAHSHHSECFTAIRQVARQIRCNRFERIVPEMSFHVINKSMHAMLRESTRHIRYVKYERIWHQIRRCN